MDEKEQLLLIQAIIAGLLGDLHPLDDEDDQFSLQNGLDDSLDPDGSDNMWKPKKTSFYSRAMQGIFLPDSFIIFKVIFSVYKTYMNKIMQYNCTVHARYHVLGFGANFHLGGRGDKSAIVSSLINLEASNIA